MLQFSCKTCVDCRRGAVCALGLLISLEWSTLLRMINHIDTTLTDYLCNNWPTISRRRFTDLLGLLCLGEREFGCIINFTSEVGFYHKQNKGATCLTSNKEEKSVKKNQKTLLGIMICSFLGATGVAQWLVLPFQKKETWENDSSLFKVQGKNTFNFDRFSEFQPQFASTPESHL